MHTCHWLVHGTRLIKCNLSSHQRWPTAGDGVRDDGTLCKADVTLDGVWGTGQQKLAQQLLPRSNKLGLEDTSTAAQAP
jgi:hypothetical protein